MTGLLSILLHYKGNGDLATTDIPSHEKIPSAKRTAVQFCIGPTHEQSPRMSTVSQGRVTFAVLPTKPKDEVTSMKANGSRQSSCIVSNARKRQSVHCLSRSPIPSTRLKENDSRLCSPLASPTGGLKRPAKVSFALANTPSRKGNLVPQSPRRTIATTCKGVLEDVLKKDNELKFNDSDEEDEVDDEEIESFNSFSRKMQTISNSRYRGSPKPNIEKQSCSSESDRVSQISDDEEDEEGSADEEDEEDSDVELSESSLSDDEDSPLRCPSTPVQTAAAPNESQIPDDTDFVPGTFDEDQPACLAFACSLTHANSKRSIMLPQDIDPTFPDSEPEDDGHASSTVGSLSKEEARFKAKAKWNYKSSFSAHVSSEVLRNSKSPPLDIARKAVGAHRV
ncbi:DUF2457 family conserved fungal protein [Schizosaccharomyces pombe]|uniref:Uncharacterized protein C1259.08 n=1 Tax=Schizosaccharomyces pombe (strain 972 / ATCC 24843) TaxID=284812 RepID=YC58_SCHPO|nr:uncharacterized protein SPCC1259.08 [Schizosaccharomyces pombe]O94708.1 RecName: Full=Uncharacterized protein C1259.08 [Schizosaccharomyces pombe 972h-]CAA22546.1 conserved fungal protein, DUF2457 family [Schizosaccharomyces pombe]|eukprot:NP_588064.1 uncharacterized protein SPCC1259.08 [Schizosaccharomyces pombe]